MSTDKLTAQVRDHVSLELQYSIEVAVGDSPIEKLFFRALWLMARLGVSEHNRIAVPCERFSIQWLLERETPTSLIVVPQVEAAGWRVDFLIYAWDYGRATGTPQWRRLIVECDGHDFHERTKEQAARDRSRDRNAQLLGYSILRFTGSEIHGDPMGCALQVSRWAMQGW